ncbi:hypothetical protein MKEN_00420200 [Mycena kentingensis (nom. inval.)]|nr:hypothetical protein MKEN_00420200 [Mycena kentingensis (nom. inval.)]
MFSSWFGETAPPPGMRVVPCNGLDLASVEMVLTTAFIVNGRLDASKLEDTLTALIVQNFPRAGSRLAHRNGVYEFQIPEQFDATTRAIAFTVEDFPEPYESPSRPSIANLLIASAPEPFVCDAPQLQPFFRSSTCPHSLQDCLKPNTPLLHVHVAAFADATFIGLSSTHALFDALGTRTLVHAWTRVLSGEPIEDIPGMPWDILPLASFTTPVPRGSHQRGWYDLGLFAKALFIFYFLLAVYRDPKEEFKHVRVPKAFLEEEKRKIMDELKESNEFVGSSDVLMAWWIKVLLLLIYTSTNPLQTSYQHRTDPTPLHLHIPVNLRPQPLFPTSALTTPYINNAAMSISIPPLTASALASTPLGTLALHIRRAIAAYTADLPGIKQDLNFRCASPGVVHFPCPVGAEYVITTNWRAAQFGQLDFSGAADADVKVLSVYSFLTTGNNMPMRGGGVILFEDQEAVWMVQVRGTRDWERVKAAGHIQFI